MDDKLINLIKNNREFCVNTTLTKIEYTNMDFKKK